MVEALKVTKEKAEVIVYTQQHRIEGQIHLHPGSRLTDFMNVKTGLGFMPITNAKVYTLSGEKLLHTADLLDINKNLVVMILPKASESET